MDEELETRTAHQTRQGIRQGRAGREEVDFSMSLFGYFYNLNVTRETVLRVVSGWSARVSFYLDLWPCHVINSSSDTP